MSRRARVLMIVENCPFQRDPRVRKEARTLHDAGYHVLVICPAGERRQHLRECIEGITVYSYQSIPTGLTFSWYLLEYAYATLAIAFLSVFVFVREGFDVIHVANPPDTLILTVAPFKLFGKSLVFDQHDLVPELFQAKFPRVRWLYPFLIRLEQWSYRIADHVITTNDSYTTNALNRGHVPASKITVVRNGPELSCTAFPTFDHELRQRSKNLILYSGSIGTQDGLDCLGRILHYLRFDLAREDFCCIIMGDGDYLPAVKVQIQGLRVQDRIFFTGWIADSNQYLRYLNTADICVSPDPPTVYNDRSTFIKIMDYMAAGKPIVAFDLAETRYSAQDSALYSPAGDERQFAMCLAKLMDQPELRNTLGKRGQSRVREQLAWQYSAQTLLVAYEKVDLGIRKKSRE